MQSINRSSFSTDIYYFYIYDIYYVTLYIYYAKKAYDTIDRHGMWHMLRVYGVGGKLLKAVQSFYVDSRACVRVENDVSEWFPG